MATKRASIKEITDFILNSVNDEPTGISRRTADQFGISRQKASKHIMNLVAEGQLIARGNTKARTYRLADLLTHYDEIAITPRLEEHVTWRQNIVPYLTNVADNVFAICEYGFTEMVNNVGSHSEGKTMRVLVERNPVWITLRVSDDGVGIFEKIQHTFGYDDPRHALLELSKGKVTSDPDHHTGEGVFFTSKMFDSFSITSGGLYYARSKRGDDWLTEVKDQSSDKGTMVNMGIHLSSDRTTQKIFDEYASEPDFCFSRTHVPILLAKYDKEQLISRSQARRVLARFDRFDEAMLDFQGVEMIGQAFADELFRVFGNEHPAVNIVAVNASVEVQRMIKRVSGDDSRALRLLS